MEEEQKENSKQGTHLLNLRCKHKKTSSKLDSPVPGILLKLSEFPETFILETRDKGDIEEELSDDES